MALTRAEEELWCSWSERSARRPGVDGRAWASPWLAPIERTIAAAREGGGADGGIRGLAPGWSCERAPAELAARAPRGADP